MFEQVDAAMEEWIVEQMYTVSQLGSHTATLDSCYLCPDGYAGRAVSFLTWL